MVSRISSLAEEDSRVSAVFVEIQSAGSPATPRRMLSSTVSWLWSRIGISTLEPGTAENSTAPSRISMRPLDW